MTFGGDNKSSILKARITSELGESIKGYTETLNADIGCTGCLCPEEVAETNRVKVKALDPD